MPVLFAGSSKSLNKELTLFLLPLLNQVSAAVNNLGIYEPDLIHLARSLNSLNECINQLHSEIATVAIDELLLVDR